MTPQCKKELAMLRITKTSSPEGRALFRLEGRLTVPEIPILKESLAGRAPSETALDLSQLRWIDDPATACLEKLIAAGAFVVACSPFVARVLAERPR